MTQMTYEQEEQLIKQYLPTAKEILTKKAVDVSQQVEQRPLANELANQVNCDPEIALLTIAKAIRLECGKLIKKNETRL